MDVLPCAATLLETALVTSWHALLLQSRWLGCTGNTYSIKYVLLKIRKELWVKSVYCKECIILNETGTINIFADHFLLGIGRGGFHLVELFLAVVSSGTVRESMVTLASWTELSRVICSELRPGGRPPSSADCWGSEFDLNTG